MARALAVAAAVLAVLLVGTVHRGTSTAAAGDGQWTPVAGLPLKQPAQIHRSAAGVLDVTLTASPQTIDVSADQLQAQPFTAKPHNKAALPPAVNGPTLHRSPG